MKLTPRQTQILHYLIAGYTRKGTCLLLKISNSTFKAHLGRAAQANNCRNTVHLIWKFCNEHRPKVYITAN